MLQICKDIRLARKTGHKTQQEMADLMGVPRTTYANWEMSTEPDIETIKQIAGILGIEFSQLVKAGFTKADKFEAHENQASDATVPTLLKVLVMQQETIQSQQYTIQFLSERTQHISDPPKNGFPPLKNVKPVK